MFNTFLLAVVLAGVAIVGMHIWFARYVTTADAIGMAIVP